MRRFGRLFYDNKYGYGGFTALGFFSIALVVTTAIIVTSLVAGNFFGARYGHRMCDRKSAAMSRPTKFVRYGFMSWDCLIQDRDGHWTSIDNIRVVNGG